MLTDVLSQIEVLKITFFNFIKLFFMTYLFFYKLPQFLYPQSHVKDFLDRIVFNVLYMLATIFVVIPLLLFFKIFSMITLFVSFFLIKVLSVYYFEKKNYFVILKEYYHQGMIKLFNFLDYYYRAQKFGKVYREYKNLISGRNITSLKFLRTSFMIVTIIYIFYQINIINFISLTYRTSDMPMYLEWVAMMHKNTLYADNLTIGAYFFGPPTIIFFLQLITNIDSNVLLNLFPSLFFLFLLIGIYYIIFKTTESHYSALFAVIIFGVYCLSPFATYLMGFVHKTNDPNIIKFLGLKIYFDYYFNLPGKRLIDYSYIPFIRINSGLPYEMAFTFYPLYIYFFIMSFIKKKMHILVLYTITLYLVFTLHGGAAIYLFLASVLILINSFIFRKIDFNVFKRGILAIAIGTILGNLWVLSVFKYGIPQSFGIAAPLLDKFFKTQRQKVEILKGGSESVYELVFYPVQLIFYFLLSLLYPLIIFLRNKKRYILSSVSLSVLALLLIYIEENLGFPRIVAKSRSCEYLLLGTSIGAGLYFNLIETFLIRFLKKYSKWFLMSFLSIFFVVSIFIVPTWNSNKKFFNSLNDMQYNATVLDIYKIKKIRRPYSWTVVGYVQSYARVLDKGFHINTQTFIEKYDPTDKYLKVPTEWIYIFKENLPGNYRGSGEWFFRWKKDIQLQLESWINLYSRYHNNIRIFDDRGFLTVYEIDNRAYMEYLFKRKVKGELRAN